MDGTQARLKHLLLKLPSSIICVERVDGTQARLKRDVLQRSAVPIGGGKGGWDSGEIETHNMLIYLLEATCGKGGWDSGEIETAKVRSVFALLLSWKGWMGLRRD